MTNMFIYQSQLAHYHNKSKQNDFLSDNDNNDIGIELEMGSIKSQDPDSDQEYKQQVKIQLKPRRNEINFNKPFSNSDDFESEMKNDMSLAEDPRLKFEL